MATAKSVTKTSAGKPAKPATVARSAKARAPAKAKAPPKPAAAAKPARPRAKKPAPIPPEQRRNYIEVAAYHIAERRGFAPGDAFDDWVKAEAEIDRLIADGLLGR